MKLRHWCMAGGAAVSAWVALHVNDDLKTLGGSEGLQNKVEARVLSDAEIQEIEISEFVGSVIKQAADQGITVTREQVLSDLMRNEIIFE